MTSAPAPSLSRPASAAAPSRTSEVRRGLAASIPMTVAVAPVGAIFGAVAAAKGLTVAEASLMSATAYAGASQFVAIDLFGRSVPAWSIILSVFAVNFRHVLYSAALAPAIRHLRRRTKAGVFFLLVDPAFAFAEADRIQGRPFSPPAYFAYSGFMYLVWLAATAVGAAFGRLADPHAFGLDMLFPIYFLAMVMGFRTRPMFWRTLAVSAAVAIAVYEGPAFGLPFGSPWHVILGGLAGILVAAFSARGAPQPVAAVADAAEPDEARPT